MDASPSALERRVAELEAEVRGLTEANVQLRAITENVREVLFLRDPHAQRMLYVNPVFEELWQISARELHGDPEAFVRAIVPEDRERVTTLLRRQQAEGTPFSAEYRIQVGAGPIRWISARAFPVTDEAGALRYVVGIARDVTERRLREESVAAHLQRLFDTAFDGILELDAVGVVTFANRRMERILGYGEGELLGLPATALLSPADAAGFPERLARRAAGLSEELELSYLRKDGSTLEARVAVSPLIERGSFVGALAMVSDVSERKRHERQLRASLTEKEVLLREVHHRVKNNLQLVSSLLSLQANTVKDEASRVVLDESRERIQSIALAHELLYRSEDLARVDFPAYLRQLVAVLSAPFARPEVTISLELCAERLELPIDVTVPCGLLLNELLTNALRHAFPQGRAGRVTVSLARQGTQCVLTVRDDGVGVLAPAVNGQPQTLGLRLVNTLVRQLGGTLHVAVSGGSVFEVEFPLPSPTAR